MATPYVVQKVPLNNTNSSYGHPHGSELRECRNVSHTKHSPDYLHCRWEYSNWCPGCEYENDSSTVKPFRSGRRRTKSETVVLGGRGLRYEPVAMKSFLDYENNINPSNLSRLYSSPDTHQSKVVQDSELENRYCNSSQYSFCHQHQIGDLDLVDKHKFSSGASQIMDIDSNEENNEIQILPNSKRYRTRLVHSKYDPHPNICDLNNARGSLLKDISENVRELDRCDGHVSDSLLNMPVKPIRVSNSFHSKDIGTKDMLGRSNFDQCYWSEDENQSDFTFPSENGCKLGSSSLHPMNSSQRNHLLQSEASFGNYPPTAREKYIREEIEVLRYKLSDLRGAEGKRLRQKSESDVPAANGFDSWDGGEPKRARDVSPNMMDRGFYSHMPKKVLSDSAVKELRSYKMLGLSHSSTSAHCDISFYQDRMPYRRESDHIKYSSAHLHKSASVCDESRINKDVECHSPQCSFSERFPPEVPFGSDDDNRSHFGFADDSGEDDHSVLSSFTTVSSDSNTPSAVGESLGSISLNDKLKERISVDETGTREEAAALVEKAIEDLISPLRPSMFSHVPPYIRFSMHDTKDTTPLVPEIQKHMKWKLSSITPLVVRRTLMNSGFRLVRKSNEWTGTWGKHMKSVNFKGIKDFQKINHFPGTFQIGRKDRLWKNLYRLMTKFGKKEFGFIPHTFILPQDIKFLRQAWERTCGKERWIIKPPASARGTGIKVIHKWAQIPKKRPLIVQKYISQPYLINGSKFDLRLYVFVTSINPLRIYIYDDGLVRFASVKYSSDMQSLSDRFMHLTNYSINKNSCNYTQNEDASACQGHKWTVKTLWTYLRKEGVDVSALWDSLVDLVIKTVISGESSISSLTQDNVSSRYSCYELFGVDVLLDDQLKPWLLEVNISPSLHSSSPLDMAVKGPMVRDLMNMAGYQIPSKLPPHQQAELLQTFNLGSNVTSLCFDRRLYTMALSKEENDKHTSYEQFTSREDYLEGILNDLTADDVRHLIQAEDEISQSGRFIKIFPTPETHKYHEFFEAPRYYNMLFDAWDTKYHNCREQGIQLLEKLCQKQLHLEVPPCIRPKPSASPTNQESSHTDVHVAAESEKREECIQAAVKDRPQRHLSASTLSMIRTYRSRNGKVGVVARAFTRSYFGFKKHKSSTLICKAHGGSLPLGKVPQAMYRHGIVTASESENNDPRDPMRVVMDSDVL